MNLAIFSGKPIFDTPKSTSNLVQPDKESFLNYIGEIYDEGSQMSGLNYLTLRLEERLAQEHGANYCVAVCNGLWGIVMSIHALRLSGKSEIVMPSLTYRRMADIAAWLQMVPHFCDVDYDTLAMNASHTRSCINRNTALILAPHPIVNLCDIDGLVALSKEFDIPILFDSVEASFAEHNTKKIGSFGDAECFSMHASKFLNGFEGGYITTNNKQFADKLRIIRNNGINVQSGLVESPGIDGKLIELHAAMTLASLDDKDNQIERNKSRFLKYKEELSGINGLTLMEYSLTEKRSFKNILVRLEKDWPLSRDLTIKILQAENMVVRPYYYPPLHKKENKFPTTHGTLEITEILMDQLMLLPCGEFISLDDIEIVADHLKFISHNADSIKEKLSSQLS